MRLTILIAGNTGNAAVSYLMGLIESTELSQADSRHGNSGVAFAFQYFVRPCLNRGFPLPYWLSMTTMFFRTRLCRAFEQREWETYDAANLEDAVRIARDAGPDLALIDLRMPGAYGLDVIWELNGLGRPITIIMLRDMGAFPPRSTPCAAALTIT